MLGIFVHNKTTHRRALSAVKTTENSAALTLTNINSQFYANFVHNSILYFLRNILLNIRLVSYSTIHSKFKFSWDYCVERYDDTKDEISSTRWQLVSIQNKFKHFSKLYTIKALVTYMHFIWNFFPLKLKI